jgi:hypothetical protein
MQIVPIVMPQRLGNGVAPASGMPSARHRNQIPVSTTKQMHQNVDMIDSVKTGHIRRNFQCMNTSWCLRITCMRPRAQRSRWRHRPRSDTGTVIQQIARGS